MTLKLIIGNKNYSSWSMRPWIAMKATGIPFDETVISLYVEGSEAQIKAHSPAGKVPILIDGQGNGEVRVWESLAILEYLADKFPAAGLWPADLAARAHARAISTEMHAGFVPLRQQCGMNMWRPPTKRDLSGDTKANVARIHQIWTETRNRFGAGGPFLFGKFSAADAMYAPVVSRFETYMVDVAAPVAAYMQAMIALPAWQEWRRAALKETWAIAKFEPDWPSVKRMPADAA
jgi:glutathione S-transferase